MPYFVYRIEPENRLEYIDNYENYREAKVRVNELRKQESVDSEVVVRMIHAANKPNAEKLLLAPRDDRIIGD